jgi:CIC family chloride channel protein
VEAWTVLSDPDVSIPLDRWWHDARRVVTTAFSERSRQVLLLAALTGIVTGLGVALFESIVIEWLFDELRDLPIGVLALMPTVGLVVAAVSLRWLGPTTPPTTDAYLHAFHDSAAGLRLRDLPARMLAAIGTLGFGGAMGLEGPSLYLGASVGAGIQSRFHRWFRSVDHRVLMVAGAAAGVAAIFKAPATGAVFALEVPYQDDFARKMLLPALVAAATGYLGFVAVHGTDPLIHAAGSPDLSAADLIGSIVLGAVGGLVARAFAVLLRRAKTLTETVGIVTRLVIAGVLLAAITVVGDAVAGQPVTIGVGYHTIAWALQPDRAVWVLLAVVLLRALATAATVSGGGVGGLFIPLVVTGAVLGRAAGAVLPGLDDQLAVIIGVASVLGGGYRVPLAAVVFVAEATGRPGFIVPALLAAVAAELVMGRMSVTTYQRRSGLSAGAGSEPSEAEGESDGED